MNGSRLIGAVAPKTPVYWIGDLGGCDVCKTQFVAVMYDAKTLRGPWGNLCLGCFSRVGVGLGTGLGQKYERQGDGRWLKTEG